MAIVPTSIAGTGTRIRMRSGRYPFHGGHPIAASEVRIDRMVLRVRATVQASTDVDLRDWLDTLGPDRGGGRVFTRVARRGPNTHFEIAPNLTVGGSGYVRPLAGGQASVDIILQANPTRTAAHNPVWYLPEVWQQTPPLQFFAVAPPDQVSQESLSLTGDDNVLPVRAITGSNPEDRSNAWQAFLETYCFQLQALVALALRPSLSRSMSVHVEIDWSGAVLRQSEFYVERYTGDAPELSRVIADRASALGAESVRRMADERELGSSVPILDIGRGQNDQWISFGVGQGRRVKIYAKRQDLIRVELVHSARLPHRLVSSARQEPGDFLLRLLNAGSRDAERRIQRVYRGLNTFIQPDDRPVDVVLLLLEVAHHLHRFCTSPLQHREVLRQLLRNGGLSLTDDRGFAPRSLIEELVSAGLLVHQGTGLRESHAPGRRYVLDPRFMAIGRISSIDRTTPIAL